MGFEGEAFQEFHPYAEAILWHSGEALPSRPAFESLPKDQRTALLAFLASL